MLSQTKTLENVDILKTSHFYDLNDNIRKHINIFGVLPLRKETGLIRSEPVTEGTSKFCNFDKIENEFLFLINVTYITNTEVIFIKV